MKSHAELHEEKSQELKHEEHEEHIGLHRNSSQVLPDNLDFRYKRMIFWVPVIAALLFVLFAIAKRTINQEQKFYCYKSVFIPTGFKQTAGENPLRQMLVNTRYGFSLYVDPEDKSTSKQIAEKGTYQPSKINLIGHIVDQGDTVLSIGQHVGLNSVIMSKVVGQKGQLIVLTPLNSSFNLISKNLKVNGADKNSKIHKLGTSDHKYKAEVQLLTQTGKTLNEEVQYQILDEFLSRTVQLNFAYIESQNQVATLLGMKDIISRSPKLVIMVKWQFNKETISSSGQKNKLKQFLQGKGYKAYTYKGGSNNRNCKLGQFIWKGDLSNLYDIKAENIILIPQNYVLPI